MKIGIVSPSSVVPKVEFEIGVSFLKNEGFEVEVHPSVYGEFFFHSASDEDRARALIEFASRPDLEAIWCARGGYGATHLIPFLDRWKKSLRGKKPSRKTLIGFSDITVLLEWFRSNLGWETLHGPMPSLRTFSCLKPGEWKTLKNLVRGSRKKEKIRPYSHALLPVYRPHGFQGVEGALTGGNIAVWNTLLGTPHQGSTRGKILFLEDVKENLGQLNRMLHHLEQAGGLKGCKALVLGDFTDCGDSVPSGLITPPTGSRKEVESFLKAPPKEALGPIRGRHTFEEGIDFVFKPLGERLGIPVFRGVPSGHGENHFPLYFGKVHSLQRNGKFRSNF